ncbi:MAG: PhoD-like phosphatase N-terminal domain-containing protein [Alicyclobacillus mali]|nr:PhoD-like phosphatase N-terminal domain-containing protein [Alicyclobacillus mali (ex Roth et al. 2021)]
MEVEWVVAQDEKRGRIVKRGSAVAAGDLPHSVHVEVSGLEPDRWYRYQFRVRGDASPVGRTRTAPQPGAQLDSLRFTFPTCQHYEQRSYTAYGHIPN